jgi:hypothetical protein
MGARDRCAAALPRARLASGENSRLSGQTPPLPPLPGAAAGWLPAGLACLTQMLCCIRQVKLDSGSLIYAPSDNDRFVKLLLGVPDTPTDRLLARERAGWVEQEDMPADSEESSSAPTMSWDDIANWDKPPSYPPPYPPNHDDCDEDERSDWPRQDWSPGEKGSGHGLSLEIEGRPMRNAHHPDGTRGLVTAEEFARLERLRLNTPHYDAMVRACVHWQGPLSECRCYVCRLDGRYVDAEDSDESSSSDEDEEEGGLIGVGASVRVHSLESTTGQQLNGTVSRLRQSPLLSARLGEVRIAQQLLHDSSTQLN